MRLSISRPTKEFCSLASFFANDSPPSPTNAERNPCMERESERKSFKAICANPCFLKKEIRYESYVCVVQPGKNHGFGGAGGGREEGATSVPLSWPSFKSGNPGGFFPSITLQAAVRLYYGGKNEEEVLLLDIGGKGQGNLSSLS